MYSTPEHPLALVFDLMDHSNLGLYLRNNGNTVRLELVRFHRYIYCESYQRLGASYWK